MSFRDRWLFSLYAWWIQFGRSSFSLSDVWNRPLRLLVCIPSDSNEVQKAVQIIPDLIASLDAEAVFLAGEPQSLEWCSLADDRITLVPLDQTAQWGFGFPSARIVDRLSNEGISLAINLNPCPELLPAMLCQRIDVPVRLCLDDPRHGCTGNVKVLLVEKRVEEENANDAQISSDSLPADPALAGAGRFPDDSTYARLLRVIQSTIGTSADLRVST